MGDAPRFDHVVLDGAAEWARPPFRRRAEERRVVHREVTRFVHEVLAGAAAAMSA